MAACTLFTLSFRSLVFVSKALFSQDFKIYSVRITGLEGYPSINRIIQSWDKRSHSNHLFQLFSYHVPSIVFYLPSIQRMRQQCERGRPSADHYFLEGWQWISPPSSSKSSFVLIAKVHKTKGSLHASLETEHRPLDVRMRKFNWVKYSFILNLL